MTYLLIIATSIAFAFVVGSFIKRGRDGPWREDFDADRVWRTNDKS